jgi:precorrin-6A/cobalt-precorrin-6A reductase
MRPSSWPWLSGSCGHDPTMTRPDADPTGTVLVLGGTAEARELAAALVAGGRPVVTALAGRVQNPALPVGEVRIGGFSTSDADGVTGLARFLVDRRCAAIIDATHPFAATISANAVAAATRASTPLLRLQRPGWADHPDADRWTWVDTVEQATLVGVGCRRPLLTTGRQSLQSFLPWADKHATVRVVDPPGFDLPARWRLMRSRGPYSYPGERALMMAARTDLLVTKDSGGSQTVAKLDAAHDLGVGVLVVARPRVPAEVSTVATVDRALDWLRGIEA